MKHKYSISVFTGIFIFLLLFFSSCEKEFNPRDTYKDITIVYGLVNIVDSIHYIRINKAFLGEESIIIMAKEPDSSLYPDEDLDVKIWEVTSNGNSVALPVGKATTINDKDSGYFYYPEQRVYSFTRTFPPTPYSTDNTIKIEITNKKTGKIIYGTTSLVNSFNMNNPLEYTRPDINPNLPTMAFRWNNAKYGRSYDVYYTFRYKEMRFEETDTSNYKIDSVVWHMGSYSAVRTGDGTEQLIAFSFNPASLYTQVKKDVPYNKNVWRMPYENSVKLDIWCGSEDLYYYRNINSPSDGITQDRPEYTNLKAKNDSIQLENEAFGIFSSRIRQSIPLRLSNDMVMKYLPETDRQFYSKNPTK